MTMVPRIGIESMVRRMDSTATLSDSSLSPRPMVRADATAAFSTTRMNLGARSLSMFSPKLRALISGLTCAAMTILLRTRIFRDEAASDYSADLDAMWKWRMADHSVGCAVALFRDGRCSQNR